MWQSLLFASPDSCEVVVDQYGDTEKLKTVTTVK